MKVDQILFLCQFQGMHFKYKPILSKPFVGYFSRVLQRGGQKMTSYNYLYLLTMFISSNVTETCDGTGVTRVTSELRHRLH